MLFVDTFFLTSVFHLLCYRVLLAVGKMRGHGITFSETEDAQLELLIQDRVIAKTLQERLRFGRPVWEEFLRAKGHTEMSNYSLFLEYADGSRIDQLTAGRLVGLYAVKLKRENKNVKTHMLALQDMFISSGRALPPGVFDSKYVKEAKKTHTRDEGRKAAEEAMEIETHAMPGQTLVEAMDEHCPDGFSWHTMTVRQVDKVFQAGMSGLVYQYGLRGGNTGRTKSAPQARKEVQMRVSAAERADDPLTEQEVEDAVLRALDGHALRAKDVLIGWRGQDGTASFMTAYMWSMQPIEKTALASMIEFCFKTSKPDNFGKRPSRKMIDMSEATINERKLAVILCKIAAYADYGSEEDLFFSRRSLVARAAPSDRKVYRLKDVSTFVKAIAESKGWGTKGFSSKSLKEAAITSFALSGGSDGETATAYGHQTVGASRHYRAQVLSGSSGSLAQVGDDAIRGLSEVDVQRNLLMHHRKDLPGQQSNSSNGQYFPSSTPGSR